MDKLELYNKATEAYYSGEEIISDLEFDNLERDLGLQNKVLGSSHNKAYTIPHPFIMGSLNKIQIHDDNWSQYYKALTKYIYKFHRGIGVIVTPKYDGCSFEMLFDQGRLVSASTRGNGSYGKDITSLIEYLIIEKRYDFPINRFLHCIRGEVLIDKRLFNEKYADKFKNPRSFVSGIINSLEWSKEQARDLSLVVYDTRLKVYHEWQDYDWFRYYPNTKPFVPQKFIVTRIKNGKDLEGIYNFFHNYRSKCRYSLDGIVIKPLDPHRVFCNQEYPEDCVAIKFKPMIQETTIRSIDWSLGKTGEWIPTIVTDPVTMDGKNISRASGSNYGNLISQGLYIGSKVILSLAGDIIPYIYKVTHISPEKDLGQLPQGSLDGCHLMAKLSDDESNHHKFINSALTLAIPNIGQATADEIWNNLKWRNDKSYNILCLKPHTIYKALGRGKSAENARDSFKEVLNHITLSEIIQSCNFTSCGPKVADQIENQLLGLPYNYAHLPEKAYKWVNNGDSLEYKELFKVLSYMKKTLQDFHKKINTKDQIPVILTGSPSKYKTKAEFLKDHPEYRETSSWSEVKIVFTGSMESTTSKMNRAMERGIEIQLY